MHGITNAYCSECANGSKSTWPCNTKLPDGTDYCACNNKELNANRCHCNLNNNGANYCGCNRTNTISYDWDNNSFHMKPYRNC